MHLPMFEGNFRMNLVPPNGLSSWKTGSGMPLIDCLLSPAATEAKDDIFVCAVRQWSGVGVVFVRPPNAQDLVH